MPVETWAALECQRNILRRRFQTGELSPEDFAKSDAAIVEEQTWFFGDTDQDYIRQPKKESP